MECAKQRWEEEKLEKVNVGNFSDEFCCKDKGRNGGDCKSRVKGVFCFVLFVCLFLIWENSQHG